MFVNENNVLKLSWKLIRRSRNLINNLKQKGFFHLLSANIIIGFLQFGSQLFVAKFLTPVELGQIKTIQSFINVAVIIAGFGFNTAVLKICSEKRELKEKKYILNQNVVYTVFSILFMLAVLFVLSKLSLLSPDREINFWLIIYMLVIPGIVYTSLFISYLQALKRIQQMAKAQILLRIIGVVILVIVTYLYGFIGFIIATILINYIATIFLYRYVKNSTRVKAKKVNIFSQNFFLGRWSVAGNTLKVIASHMDIFMINYFIDDRESLGYYSLSTIFILGLNYITATVQSIATTYFSEKSEDRKEFIRVLKKYQKLMIILSFCVSVISFLLVPKVIILIYGDNYYLSGSYFRILVFKYFFWSCYSLLGVSILGLGKIRYNFLSVLISVIISGLLNYFLLNMYGVRGAAISQGITYFVTLFVVYFMTKRAIRIHFNSV